MTKLELDEFEAYVIQTARGFVYPRTPVVRRVETRRTTSLPMRLTWAALVVLMAVGLAMLAVPSVRAAVLRFLQIGVVRIEVAPPTAMPSAPPAATPQATPTPTRTPQPLADQLNLYGRTTLTHVRASGVAVKVPAALGQPDAVYLQDLGGSMAVLVWFDEARPGEPGKVRMSLQVFTNAAVARKMQPKVLRTTQVKGREAAWVQGEHVLQVRGGNYEVKQLVSANALIWTEGKETYRLETDLTMAEAVRIAESTP